MKRGDWKKVGLFILQAILITFGFFLTILGTIYSMQVISYLTANTFSLMYGFLLIVYLSVLALGIVFIKLGVDM